MKKLFFYIGLCASVLLFAQNKSKPQYPGGEQQLISFLSKNIIYPTEANKNRWQGKTLISFNVNEDGSLSDFAVQKSSWPVLDAEALRVVKLMPNWMPATENGKAVKEKVVLPIMFNLKMRDKGNNNQASE